MLLDSPELAAANRRALDIPRDRAAELGRSAVAAAEAGAYFTHSGQEVYIAAAVTTAVAAKRSIAPDDALPPAAAKSFPSTRIEVANLTTLQAARRLADQRLRPLALNFANGLHPGGGFLSGALAQEEVLCRSSALYLTLVGDPMYAFHAQRPEPDSSAWCIFSPDVPVFRTDNGIPLDEPWLLSFITCAAPVAQRIGQPRSAELLRQRIHRVLASARAIGYESLVLGAWGCGAFGNDPHRTAADFKEALDTEFAGAFANITFAITDWSKERRILGPFGASFAPERLVSPYFNAANDPTQGSTMKQQLLDH